MVRHSHGIVDFETALGISRILGQNDNRQSSCRIKQFAVLSSGVEQESFYCWRDSHNVAEASWLTASYRWLVAKITRDYHGFGFSAADLTGEGIEPV
jgi:hypothetical protein